MSRKWRRRAEELPDWPDVEVDHLETDSFRYTFPEGVTVTGADLRGSGAEIARRGEELRRQHAERKAADDADDAE